MQGPPPALLIAMATAGQSLKLVVEASRGAVIAVHAAGGLARGHVQALRLLRVAEGLCRGAVAVLQADGSKCEKTKGMGKDKDKSKSDKKGSDWRSKGNWRGRDSNQDSGKSQSSDKRRNDNNDWRSRRNTEHGKGSGNGSTNGRDNRRDNTNATRAQVNSQILNGSNVIAQVNHLRQAKANEDRHRDSEENVAKLCDAVSGIAEQLDNFVTASTMALHGDRFYDCHDHYALCDDDYVFYDAPEAPPAVMQVMSALAVLRRCSARGRRRR